MRMRYVIAFKDDGEVVKTVARCDNRIGAITKKEEQRIGEYQEIYYFDTIDELIEYVLLHPEKCKIKKGGF